MSKISTVISLFLALLILSCNNNQENSNSYKPNREKEEVTPDRERELARKKSEFNSRNMTQEELYKMSDSLGTTKISVFIPETESISTTEVKIIETKLIQMLTINGVGGVGGTPRFILTPVITQTKQDITNTAPTMYSNKYEMTLYIADAMQGDVFSTTSVPINGVGQSPLKAFINAFENINPKDKQFFEFVSSGKNAITEYYSKNCGNILNEAEKFVNKKQFNEALTIIDAIPSKADCYEKAVVKSGEIFQKLIDNDCELVLSKMKAELGKSNDPSASGFNEPAMAYYSMINPSSKCYSEAEKIYKDYLSKLNPKAKRDWEQSMKVYQDELENKKKEWEYKKYEAELKAKMTVEGNNELLEIYRKQYNYEKLPWARKWLHLGNYDPFDGTK